MEASQNSRCYNLGMTSRHITVISDCRVENRDEDRPCILQARNGPNGAISHSQIRNGQGFLENKLVSQNFSFRLGRPAVQRSKIMMSTSPQY